MIFQIHKARECNPIVHEKLMAVESQLGFLPNVFGLISESQPALETLIEMNNQFAQTSLNAEQREIVQLVASVENDSDYCVAGHTAFYSSIEDDLSLAKSIRESMKQLIAGENHDANAVLANFTRQLIQVNGKLTDEQLKVFHDAGFNSRNVLEVILGVAIKTITNLSNNVARTSLDEPFEEYRWKTNT